MRKSLSSIVSLSLLWTCCCYWVFSLYQGYIDIVHTVQPWFTFWYSSSIIWSIILSLNKFSFHWSPWSTSWISHNFITIIWLTLNLAQSWLFLFSRNYHHEKYINNSNEPKNQTFSIFHLKIEVNKIHQNFVDLNYWRF